MAPKTQAAATRKLLAIRSSISLRQLRGLYQMPMTNVMECLGLSSFNRPSRWIRTPPLSSSWRLLFRGFLATFLKLLRSTNFLYALWSMGWKRHRKTCHPSLRTMCPKSSTSRRRVPEIRIFRIGEPDPRRPRLVNSTPKKQRLLWYNPHKRRVDLQIIDFWDVSIYYAIDSRIYHWVLMWSKEKELYCTMALLLTNRHDRSARSVIVI